MRVRKAATWLGACLLLLAWPRPASADPEWIIGYPSDEIRMTDLSFGMLFDGREGFGLLAGAQLAVPILDAGLIRPINDALYVEPGLFVGGRFHHGRDDHWWVVPEVGPRWNFYLTPHWDAFASIKFGWAIGRHGDFWVRGTAGARWWFLPQLALRAEVAAASVVGGEGYLGLSYRFL